MTDQDKEEFINELRELCKTLPKFVSTSGGAWSIKGFIDTKKTIYTISCDTKLISKVLEIQLLPKIYKFANGIGYEVILAEKQNWYPDISFVNKTDNSIKFAVDIKSTYRLDGRKDYCSGFTLGSHGEYFRDRTSTKNIQFPYGDYKAHITLGVIYSRVSSAIAANPKTHNITKILSITSVIKNLLFFVEEKWKISSDRPGSGNTANIGSIKYIPDILSGNGIFAGLGEKVFDEYWVNQGVLQVPDPKRPREFKKLTKLSEFLDFKGIDHSSH